MSALARIEVPAALWRKERLGELDTADAEVLTAAFEADYFGTDGEQQSFAAIAVHDEMLNEAAELVASHGLRAYDAVQLAGALAARRIDPSCSAFACFDGDLRRAAGRLGFEVVPSRA